MFKGGRHHEDHYLELAIRGQREGLEYLVGAYRSLAYTIAMRVLANKEDAEEVVQDAFLKAFASLGNFKRASKFSTWLYRIVYNTALTKRSARPAEMLDLDGQQEIPDNGSDALENADRKKYIALALDRLKPEDRLIVTLHYIAEKSIAETGGIMGLKPSAVKMRATPGPQTTGNRFGRIIPDELNEIR